VETLRSYLVLSRRKYVIVSALISFEILNLSSLLRLIFNIISMYHFFNLYKVLNILNFKSLYQRYTVYIHTYILIYVFITHSYSTWLKSKYNVIIREVIIVFGQHCTKIQVYLNVDCNIHYLNINKFLSV